MAKKRVDIGFGDYLKKILTEKGLSQRDLAIMSGISEGAISRYISSDRIPMPHIIHKLASTLDEDFSEYLDDYIAQMQSSYEKPDSSYNGIAKAIAESDLTDTQRANLIYLLIRKDLSVTSY